MLEVGEFEVMKLSVLITVSIGPVINLTFQSTEFAAKTHAHSALPWITHASVGKKRVASGHTVVSMIGLPNLARFSPLECSAVPPLRVLKGTADAPRA